MRTCVYIHMYIYIYIYIHTHDYVLEPPAELTSNVRCARVSDYGRCSNKLIMSLP